MTGSGARARQKAKREAWLKNMPYPGFICKVCKHEDMMHFMWAGYCILENCDCQSMDGIKPISGPSPHLVVFDELKGENK